MGDRTTSRRILSALPERPSGNQIRDAMVALGVGRTTLFRWLKQFREGARTSALLPRRRGPNSGMRPLAPDVLAIVERHFRDFYATRRRPTVTRFWAEIAADCRREGLAVPSIRRLDRWLARHDQAELLLRREGKGKSEPVFLATPGKLRGGRAAGDRADRPHQGGRDRCRSRHPASHWPSDADAGDRCRLAHGDGISPLARSAVADGGSTCV